MLHIFAGVPRRLKPLFLRDIHIAALEALRHPKAVLVDGRSDMELWNPTLRRAATHGRLAPQRLKPLLA
jgi:hypothetical protein